MMTARARMTLLHALLDAGADVGLLGPTGEVRGGGYKRQRATFVFTDGEARNAAELTWRNMPATQIFGVALYDDQGDAFWTGPLTNETLEGMLFVIPAGEIVATVEEVIP